MNQIRGRPSNFRRLIANIEPASLARLAPREREYVYLTQAGYTINSIAEQMGVKWRTLWTYQCRIKEKLGKG